MKKIIESINYYHKIIIAVLIGMSFPLIYLFVYYTGGIKYVYSHTMYIPILLAGIVFGFKYGVICGLIAGVLLGPLMPLVVETNEPQVFFNWFYRMIMFVLIGGLSGYFFDKYKKTLKKNEKLYLHHPDTKVPNINFLMEYSDTYIDGKVLIASIIINNKNRISEVLGTDIYIKVINVIYHFLDDELPKESIVVQADSEKLWVLFKLRNMDEDGEKITKILSHDLDIEGIKLFIDFSIGISESINFKACKTLIPFRDSDRLAGYAKENNLPYVIFDKELLHKKYEFNLLGSFSNALKNNETFLTYQPIIDSNTGSVVAVEALIRWLNPDHGLIMPNDFIPLVESTKLIHSMTNWVIRNAVRKQIELKENGLDIFVSINLSSKNLHNPLFYKKVVEIIAEENGNPNKLIFEVTETVLLKEDKYSKKTIEKFKEAGFRMAIDDFGKGYSSLTYLNLYEIDYLKIDRHFMSKIINSPSVLQIVEATVNLAHQFNLKVVAEGVEDQETYDKILGLGVDYIQGFLIAKPIKQDKVLDWCTKFNNKNNKSKS
ncbi:MAG: EAL domain-containing protein [Candidatus Izimaplasma sp.]|nr:EAL domain-containing protein [Candidatus Izimaplasma bacterium]